MWQSLKRRPVLFPLLSTVGALAVGLVCFPYGRGVTPANCERIQEGMTEAEVRALLGKPWDDSLLDPDGPGEAGTIRHSPIHYLGEDPVVVETVHCDQWIGDNLTVFVVFDDDRRVVSVEVFSDPGYPQTRLPARVWRRLRARCGL
jgi:hypothetical protein